MPGQIDSREAWLTTLAALVVASVSLGAPYVVIVALKPIAEELGGMRSVPSGAMSLAMLGTGVGGLAMGWVAERVGVRAVVIFGAVMVFAGLTLSSRGEAWQLYLGHGLLMGLIGNSAINAPLYIYVTKWFEARRGTAVALIASGPNVAGACWPPLFERAIAAYGWRQTMVAFGLMVVGIVVPLAALFLRPPPDTPKSAVTAGGGSEGTSARTAAQYRFCAARGRLVPVLRTNGNAARARDRTVWRSRHDASKGCGHANRDAGVRLHRPAAMGVAVGQCRRAVDVADRVVSAGCGYRRLYDYPG